MTHSIITLEPEELSSVLNNTTAINVMFLHPYVQSVIADVCIGSKRFVNVAMPNLTSLNVVLNGRNPMIISFDL